MKQLITHELNHIIEFYNLIKNNRDIPKHGKIKIGIENFKKINNYNNYFDAFLHYIYLTLDNEFNARAAETYQYLKSFNIIDKDILIDYLETSEIWLKMIEIENFDSVRFTNFLIKNTGLDATIVFINLISRSLSDNIVVTSQDDIIKYFNSYKKKFNYKIKKHKSKLLNIINEVIKDLTKK